MGKEYDCDVCNGTGNVRVHIAGSYHGTRPQLDEIWECSEYTGLGVTKEDECEQYDKNP